MGRSIPEPQRQMIFQRAGLGHKTRDIAADLGLNVESVRSLIRRLQRTGISGIPSDYSRCGVHQSGRAEVDLIQAAINDMDRRQRESYPYRGQASRLAAYPEMKPTFGDKR